MNSGDVQSVLIDLQKFIEEALMEGESVTIKGLGSFHVAVTSDGFEHPDDVMPGKVRLSLIHISGWHPAAGYRFRRRNCSTTSRRHSWRGSARDVS